jgi:hypothetical protein
MLTKSHCFYSLRNRGIWTRDIKIATNIPQHTLTKTLKILEQRSLIKSVRSVVSKSKKLYVLFDVVPAKSVTGGPWYSDQEFDHEFVSELSNFIVQMVHAEKMMDLVAIAEKIRISGISKVMSIFLQRGVLCMGGRSTVSVVLCKTFPGQLGGFRDSDLTRFRCCSHVLLFPNI